jgi:hypothetical protein
MNNIANTSSKFLRFLKIFGMKETLEKSEGAIKNGQSRETVNKRETTEGAIKNGQSRETVNKCETTEGAIKNGQSREKRRSNQEWTIQRNCKQM